jgi:predicted RNA-binding protein (TIGR00451 family)
MQELRRTRSGPFTENDGSKVTLHDVAYWFSEWEQKKDDAILRRFIVPMEEALSLLPKVVVRDSAVDALCHGANLTAPGVLQVESGIKKGSVLAVFTLKGEAVALGGALVSTEDMLDLRHGAVVGLERVLMERGTYPKVWKTGSEHESGRS